MEWEVISRFEEIKLSRDTHTMHMVSDDQRTNQKELFEHLNMVTDARRGRSLLSTQFDVEYR